MKEKNRIDWERFSAKVQELHSRQDKFWPRLFLIPFLLFVFVMFADMVLSPEKYSLLTALAKILFIVLIATGVWLLPYPPKCIITKDNIKMQRPNFVFPARIFLFFLLFIPIIAGFMLTESKIDSSPAKFILIVILALIALCILGAMKLVSSLNIFMKEVGPDDILSLGVSEHDSEGVKQLAREMWKRLDDFEIEGCRYYFKPCAKEAMENPVFQKAQQRDELSHAQ